MDLIGRHSLEQPVFHLEVHIVVSQAILSNGPVGRRRKVRLLGIALRGQEVKGSQIDQVQAGRNRGSIVVP